MIKGKKTTTTTTKFDVTRAQNSSGTDTSIALGICYTLPTRPKFF